MKRLEKDHRELQEKLKVCYTIIIAVEIIVIFAIYWTKPIPDKINKTLCPKKTAKILSDKMFFPHKNLVEYIVFLTKLFSTLYFIVKMKLLVILFLIKNLVRINSQLFQTKNRFLYDTVS